MLADRIRMSAGKTKKLIDRTTPVTVVDQPYRTTGNGGRKLVRLDNGWLVTVLYDVSTKYTYFYVSKNNGASWAKLTQTSSGLQYEYSAIVNNGNYIYCLLASTTGAVRYVHFNAENISGYVVINNIENQSYVSSCSLAINEDGTELHACWPSKNSTYPNSFNIRYCKGIINGDGSVTWDSVEQVTKSTNTSYDMWQPTIIIRNDGKPMIIYSQYNIQDGMYIKNTYFNGTSWTNIGYTSGGTIYFGFSYTQSNPSACVDKDGVIHVAWSGIDSQNSNYVVKYSKSYDGGVTWATTTTINTTKGEYPTITVNSKNKVFVTVAYGGNNLRCYELVGDSWNIIKEIVNLSVVPHPSTLFDASNSLDFEIPCTIYMSNCLSSPKVEFYGKWYE